MGQAEPSSLVRGSSGKRRINMGARREEDMPVHGHTIPLKDSY